ncbi:MULTISPECIES: cysteine desulfurase family protein [Bacillus]|jgi:cysteine desulfurase|uniref:cysteine desulfurase family protein n=1 Tax=Bacillus TaxID=1386 RepID=UPI00065DF42D|nr:cysteine desulfurase family protein [Bacillus smithii]AKP47922.1 Cysteine desulfurase [Bacillus smithii]MED0659063.1 cysteine desulfurase family protein [Bacillus smithii]MED4884627.1 cysteine desulfurase family protein [Bacillus smithii]MED4926068.1 cysteine desulfurase family protein [Bacillus smithii]
MERIYLDHAATSPVHPEVIQVLTETMQNHYGNPSSIHYFGRDARQVVDQAREFIAKSIHANFDEIIFTSGGTEADNLALIGVARGMADKGKHIITTAVEHHAVLHTCEFLEKEGFEVTYLPVDETGRISVEELKKALRDDTILVSIMFANNEVGTLQPIREVGELLTNHQAVFHTDAVQAYGLADIDVQDLHIDLLSVSSHKINGPKGVGFLYVRDGVRLIPTVHGGEQERKRRAGTENVASIAAFAKAVEISQKTKPEKYAFYHKLKQLLIETLKKEGVDFSINGTLEQSLPHVVNLSFPGTNVEAMLVNLDLEGIAASSGSACTAGSVDPSHVLRAMFGSQSDRLTNSIRFSFGINNTEDQILQAAAIISKIVKRLTKQ